MSSEAQRIAELRQKDAPSTRRLSKDYDLVGVLGEMRFEKDTGLPMDKTRLANGDIGWDFLRWSITIDVKTARYPRDLLIEKGKLWADIYVFMVANAELTDAYPVGWIPREIAAIYPIKVSRFGLHNHTVPRDALAPMEGLYRNLDLPLRK